MKPLTNNQIDYVLFHLQQHVELNEDVLSAIHYGEKPSIGEASILIKQSAQLEPKERWLVGLGKRVPVLFPVEDTDQWYTLINTQLIFHHDLFKSAFYLLSGFQEWQNTNLDEHGRYRFDASIQHRLNCVTIPLVNYYFEVFIKGLEEWASANRTTVLRKRLFEKFGLMLTHDVDRVDYYHWRESIFKWLQLFGIKKSEGTKKQQLKKATETLLHLIMPWAYKNKWWSFDWMRALEKQYGLTSVWYFLNKDGSPHDAKYELEDPHITTLIKQLEVDGCEIGLHGSISTATSSDAYAKAKSRLEQISSLPIVGTRQHFLKVHYPATLQIHQETGIHYDTSLGFAEYEGFRNSYCYPFKPYNFEADCMMDIWEYPLACMETTLYGYRRLSHTQANDAIQHLMDEVKQFGGLFVLLWHNCNFDEIMYPNISNFYAQLLQQCSQQMSASVTGREMLKTLNQ